MEKRPVLDGKRCSNVKYFAFAERTRKLKVPEGVHLLFLPVRSPELQPAERLWPCTNEAVANYSFSSLDELEETVLHCCQVLPNRPNFIQGLTGFHWWIDAIV